MRIVIAPDSFKGSLPASKVSQAIAKGILSAATHKNIEVIQIPLADGGEGTANALTFKNDAYKRVSCLCKDPLGRNIKASFYWNDIEKSAILEMASASGLQHVAPKDRNIMASSTFGTGQLLTEIIKKGATKITIGMGGSATNDAGIGMASALGFKFFDEIGNQVYPIPLNFLSIASFEKPIFPKNIKINALYDVAIPLLGKKGCVTRYSTQKGAKPNERTFLENGIAHVSKLVLEQMAVDQKTYPGDGAAGGLGFGLRCLLGANLSSGFNEIAKLKSLNQEIEKADWVIGGEGSIDFQTMDGKVLSGLAQLCKQYTTPLIAVCGVSNNKMVMKELLDAKDLLPIVSQAKSTQDAITNASFYLEMIGGQIARKYLN